MKLDPSKSSSTSPPLRRRAFQGLAGSALARYQREVQSLVNHPITFKAALLHDGRTVDLPPVKLSRRGRPLSGVVKKSSAQIKREQRAKQKEQLVKVMASLRWSQERQRKKTSAYFQLQSELEAALSALNAAPDVEALKDVVIRIRDQIAAQQAQDEYRWQQRRAERRPDPATPDGDMFISDAPQGKGKIIFGHSEDPNTGFHSINGGEPAVLESDNHARRVSGKRVDVLDHAKYKPDIVPFINLRRWVFAKVVRRSPKELKALLAEYPLMSFFQPVCSHCDSRAMMMHPEDRRRRLSEHTRFWCADHRAELSGQADGPSK